jgi:hypothetical protein
MSKQRQKKGEKVASAAGAAAMLGANAGGFIGFSSFAAPAPAAAATTSPRPNQTQSLIPYYNGPDSDLELTLKKVSKKDVITKMKALHEFRALIESRQPKVIRGALPHWTYLFGQLTMHNDRRVRELANITQLDLCKKIPKAVQLKKYGGMAGQLKKQFGAWWVAISDPHRPAALKAQQAYDAVFPTERQKEIIFICKAELFTHFAQNLNSTPQSLVATLSVKMEKLEAEEMHERIRAMTLNSIARVFTFLGGISKDDDEVGAQTLQDLEEECTKLMQGMFWRVLADKHAPIRRAAYSVVSEVIRRFPALMEQQLPSATSPVLSMIGEKVSAATSDALQWHTLWRRADVLMRLLRITARAPPCGKPCASSSAHSRRHGI